jgi:hypothetical protein
LRILAKICWDRILCIKEAVVRWNTSGSSGWKCRMAKWGLARRFKIGVSGAQLRRMAVHREARFYRNSRTNIYNNKINKQIKLK